MLSGKVLVGGELVRDPLGELVPVEVADQLLEVLPVYLLVAAFLSEGAHVDLDEAVVLEGAGQVEARARLLSAHVVVDRAELLRECVQRVQLLYLEAQRVVRVVLLGARLLEGVEQRAECEALELLLHLHLRQVEVELVGALELALSALDQAVHRCDRLSVLVRGARQQVGQDVRRILLLSRLGGFREEVLVEVDRRFVVSQFVLLYKHEHPVYDGGHPLGAKDISLPV